MRDACGIANYIFRPSLCAETGDVINLLSRTPYQNGPAVTDTVTGAEAFLSTVSDHLEKTLYVDTKEHSGYRLLSLFMVFFCKQLTKLGREYKQDLQFEVANNKLQGMNPCCDSAIVAIIADGVLLHILYEYKPSVHPHLGKVPHEALLELALQCYYAINHHRIRHTFLCCITDLSSWHYFKVCANSDGGLAIGWHHLINDYVRTLSMEAIKEHVTFLMMTHMTT